MFQGYGNKMYSLISGFTVALVTNSALIVNWAEIGKYIQEPLYKCFQPKTNLKSELDYGNPKQLANVFKFPYMSQVSFRHPKNLSRLYKWSSINLKQPRLVFIF
jgi:hypothetical protein